MSILKPLRWPAGGARHTGPEVRAALRLAALALRCASAALARLARRLAPAGRCKGVAPQLEFYAEAGAPEGALYLDGQLVGWLPGVQRL